MHKQYTKKRKKGGKLRSEGSIHNTNWNNYRNVTVKRTERKREKKNIHYPTKMEFTSRYASNPRRSKHIHNAGTYRGV